ncbi:MAG: phosphoribosylformylglycinamidine synthase subunit PurL [Synergistetes bacterium]|nr:phosphoribosylformylglycinamidine synthase subunit PurL [Synergistota bacterium]
MALKTEDKKHIVKLLGREPTATEEAMFDVMWSEHCSYRSSKRFLKMLPTKGNRVVQGPGENAGVIELNEKWYLAMKMESHNHPSAIEPYQGAATGVGGIIRDILAMGARPIALMDSLWFGDYSEQKTQYYLNGVVSGIADYGNCIGVPVVGGETVFLAPYKDNPLVNVLCVGIVEKERMLKSAAKGTGNLVVLVGSKTGRDGIGGASFASEELNDESEEKKPSVQVGDPFTEKLLIEACLEATSMGKVVAMQDLGAAGLTSSLSEMASKGNCGIQVELSNVPLREIGMKPEEIMISESQERMALIVKPEDYDAIKGIFEKWSIDCTIIGKVTEDRRFVVKHNGKVVADLDPRYLTESVPSYQGEMYSPKDERVKTILYNTDKDLSKLLKDPNFMDKSYIYEQYDHMVGINTILPVGAGASVLRLKETMSNIGISLAIAGENSSERAVKRAYRAIVASGAEPVAITDCLNFGNPEDPEIYGEFAYLVEELANICKALSVPIISGNVSFYNEANEEAIPPTVVVGMVGTLKEVNQAKRPILREKGSTIIAIKAKEIEEELAAKESILDALDCILSMGHSGRAGILLSITRASIRGKIGIKIDSTVEDAAYWLEVKDINSWEKKVKKGIKWSIIGSTTTNNQIEIMGARYAEG